MLLPTNFNKILFENISSIKPLSFFKVRKLSIFSELKEGNFFFLTYITLSKQIPDTILLLPLFWSLLSQENLEQTKKNCLSTLSNFISLVGKAASCIREDNTS